jgi:catechol 2,3-dioxygenase-like lactoylglutathione lyase family enzyme
MDWKLEVVVVPVADVDTAKRFYAEQVGFSVDNDTAETGMPGDSGGSGMRVVQLTPPGSGCSIAIGTGLVEGMQPGSLHGLQLVVPDVEAARAELAGRGVDVTPVRHVEGGQWVDGHGGPWNSFTFFSDPDGNSWAVQEKPE